MSPIVAIMLPDALQFNEPPSTQAQVKKIVVAITTTDRNPSIPSIRGPGFGKQFLEVVKQSAYHHGTTLFHISEEIGIRECSEVIEQSSSHPENLRLSLCVRADQNDAPTAGKKKKNQTIVQIQWPIEGNLKPIPFYKSMSEIGIWNHLTAMDKSSEVEIAGCALLQPNIVHSWERVENSRDDHRKVAYAQVTPLPGRPLWRWVNNPVWRLALLSVYGKEWLLRSRVDETSGQLLTVGDSLVYHYCPPDRLPDGFLDEICAMVAAGGTVATTHVRYNLKRAYLIGYVMEKGVIVGNSSLKNPRPAYIESIRKQSGLDLTGYVERGYTSIRPQYRGLGIGTKLLEGLTRRAGDRKLFSVISEDNEATKIIAKRNRTRKVATYFSEKAGKKVGIWMPERMAGK